MTVPTAPPPAGRPRPRRDVWERWIWIWHGVFYFSLVAATAIALLSGNARGSRWTILGLSLALAIWYGLFVVPLSRSKRKRPPLARSLLFLAGAFALWFPLARLHPAYYVVAACFYGYTWGTLPFGLAVAVNVLLTGLIIWSQALTTGRPVAISSGAVLVGVISIGWATLLALWVRSIMLQSRERQTLIEQLEAARESLAATERQRGVLEERQRLSREIHDTLAQGFTSVVMQLEAAEQALPEELPLVREHIGRARDVARASLREARRLVMALRPEPLEGASLGEALARVTQRWTSETGIPAAVTVTGSPRALHPEAEVTLLRAAQEGLTNVLKHARAGQVTITLSYMEDEVALDVQDDGIGFDAGQLLAPATAAQDGLVARARESAEVAVEDPARRGGGTDSSSESLALGGFGLRAMRERVEQLGGTVGVESLPGEGTTLAVVLPIDMAGRDGDAHGQDSTGHR